LNGAGGPARSCTAIAGTNIALVKYWGKRDAALNLPATGSLSLTLAELGTRAKVVDRRALVGTAYFWLT